MEVSQGPEGPNGVPVGPGCCRGACYRGLEALWRENLAEWSKPHRGSGGQGSKPQCPPLSGRESLPLPYLKQEELPNIPSEEPPCPALQYVLCAATSPAVKQQEEALTYLNQGTWGLGSRGVSGAANSGGWAQCGLGWQAPSPSLPSEWGLRIPFISPRPVL